MFTFCFAVYYNVVFIENKKIVKIFEEQFKHTFKNMLGHRAMPQLTHFHWNYLYGQMQAVLGLESG